MARKVPPRRGPRPEYMMPDPAAAPEQGAPPPTGQGAPPPADGGPTPPPAPRPMPASPADNRSPWPMRLVVGVIALALVGIVLAVVLHSPQSTSQPQTGNSTDTTASTGATNAANNSSSLQVSATPQQQPDPNVPGSSTAVAPTTTTAAPQTSTTPQPTPNPSPTPSPTPQPTPSPNPAPAPTPSPTPSPTPTPTPSPQPSPSPAPSPAPRPSPSPSPAPSPQPRPSPAPAPAPNRAPRPMFSPRDANRVVQQAARTEQAAFGKALGDIGRMLRQPEYQDPDMWGIMQSALATTGTTMIPGGIQKGHAEIIALITRSRNGREAADRIQAVGHNTPAIPLAAQQALVAVLERCRNYQEAVAGLQQVQQQYGLQFAPDTTRQLQSAFADAARRMGP
jgi:type II secretory pathway pseudopilin PulG